MGYIKGGSGPRPQAHACVLVYQELRFDDVKYIYPLRNTLGVTAEKVNMRATLTTQRWVIHMY